MADHQPAPRMQPAPRINGQSDRGGVNPNGIPSEAIRARQRMLIEKGYTLTIDGIDGEGTQRAYRDWQGKQQERAAAEQQRLEREAEATREAQRSAQAVERSKAEAESKRADAAAKAAEARAAEAAAKAKEAEAAAASTKAQAEKDKREADAKRNAISGPIMAASIATGFVGGKLAAKAIEKQHKASVDAKNAELKKSAAEIEKLTAKAAKQKGAPRSETLKQIAGKVRAADLAGLGKAKGSLGLPLAAFLIADGIGSRYLASQEPEGFSRDLFNEAGSAFLSAGAALAGQRLQDARQNRNILDAKSLGTVEGGRKIAAKQLAPPVKRQPRPVAPTTPVARAATAARVHGGKVGIGIGAATALAMMANAANASDGTGDGSASHLAKAAVYGAGAYGAYRLGKYLLAGSDTSGVKATPAKGPGLTPRREYKGHDDPNLNNDTRTRRQGFHRQRKEAEAAAKSGKPAGWSDAAREASAESRAKNAKPEKATSARSQVAAAKREAKAAEKAIAAGEQPKALTPKAAPPPVPTDAKPAPSPVKGSGVAKAAGKLNTLLAGASLAAGLFSLVKVARENGVSAAGAEALKAIDPTGGVVGKVLEKLNAPTEDKPADGDLRAIAKEQAQEREKAAETNPTEIVAREAALAQMGGVEPELLGIKSGAAGIVQAIAEGHLEGGQAELAMRTMAAGGGALARFYGGSYVAEIAQRGEQAKMAGDYAREMNNREPSPPEPSMARTVPSPQQPAPSNAPRGWANPAVQKAAQEARRLKGLT